MRRVFLGSLTPKARMGVDGDGGRHFAEARAQLLLVLAALAASSVMAVVLASPRAGRYAHRNQHQQLGGGLPA